MAANVLASLGNPLCLCSPMVEGAATEDRVSGRLRGGRGAIATAALPARLPPALHCDTWTGSRHTCPISWTIFLDLLVAVDSVA